MSETQAPVIHIACAANERYAGYCAAMLHSAFANAGRARLEIHFLHPEGLPELTLRRLRDMVEGFGGRFSPAAIDENALAALPRTSYFPRIIWYRILLPELRPELERVLYLDCDTLIMDSLLELWQTDLEQFYVAAVQNLIEPRFATRHHSMGIPPGQVYFNSGVLLLNLKLIREQRCVERIYEYAAHCGSRSVWPDQDALNQVLGPKCLFLHPRWNCQNSFFFWPQALEVFGEKRLAEATRTPAILHFEGPPDTKPWHYLNAHPFRNRYWHHLRSTPFPTPPPEGRNAKNMLRRYLPRDVYESLGSLRRGWLRWRRGA